MIRSLTSLLLVSAVAGTALALTPGAFAQGKDAQERDIYIGKPAGGDHGGENVSRTEEPRETLQRDWREKRETERGSDAGWTTGERGSAAGETATEVVTEAVVTEVERQILGDYAGVIRRTYDDGYGDRGRGRGKGKGKGRGAKGLPPGIVMNLQRGKPLPPGLRDRHIPADLQSLLPGRKDARLVPAGEDVLLVDKETEIILDVVKGVLRGMGG